MNVSARSQAKGLLNLSELIVEEELCINLRSRVQLCSACRDVCGSDALALSTDGVDVDGDKCTGCNGCLPSCPAGALRSTGFVPERFLQALAGKETVHLHCRVSGDDGGGIIVPCHSVLDAKLLTAVRAEGVTTIALHGLDRCSACKLGDARSHIGKVAVQLDAWMGRDAPELDVSPQVDKKEQRQYQDRPHMSRRSFLRFGGVNTVKQEEDWIVPGIGREVDDVDALPFFQADIYPQRAAQYQRVLVSRTERVPWQDEATPPFTVRTVSEACSGCLICGERCPIGALKSGSTPSLSQLSFDPALCTDCGLCEAVCPEQALAVENMEDISTLHDGRSTLYFRQRHPCALCGAPFDPKDMEGEICPVCSNEQDLDEEWLEILSG